MAPTKLITLHKNSSSKNSCLKQRTVNNTAAV